MSPYEVAGERAIAAAAPTLRQRSQKSMENHGEEVVHERRIPARQEPTFEIKIMGGELIYAHVFERIVGRSQGAVQALVKFGDAAVECGKASDQPADRAQKPRAILDAIAPLGAPPLINDFVLQRLPPTHHLFHEWCVYGETRKNRD